MRQTSILFHLTGAISRQYRINYKFVSVRLLTIKLANERARMLQSL